MSVLIDSIDIHIKMADLTGEFLRSLGWSWSARNHVWAHYINDMKFEITEDVNGHLDSSIYVYSRDFSGGLGAYKYEFQECIWRADDVFEIMKRYEHTCKRYGCPGRNKKP